MSSPTSNSRGQNYRRLQGHRSPSSRPYMRVWGRQRRRKTPSLCLRATSSVPRDSSEFMGRARPGPERATSARRGTARQVITGAGHKSCRHDTHSPVESHPNRVMYINRTHPVVKLRSAFGYRYAARRGELYCCMQTTVKGLGISNAQMRLVLIGPSIIALIAIFETVEAVPMQQNRIDLRRRWSFKSIVSSLFTKEAKLHKPLSTKARINQSGGEIDYWGSFD